MQTVLVVEDDQDIAQLLTTLLDLEGYHVLLAPNGQAAQQLLHHDPALIVTDLYMPECDGLQFLELLRSDSRYQSLPVILISANPPAQLSDLYATIIPKPFQPPILLRHVKRMLDGSYDRG